MKTYTVSEELVWKFANLMYVGFTPEEIKHKLSLSSEMLEALHEVYFNDGIKNENDSPCKSAYNQVQ